MVAGVGDIQIVVCVERNSIGTAEQCRLRMFAVALIARRAALASDGTESAVVVNGADAVIEGVGEKDTAIGVNGDVAGPVERDISSWCAFIGCASAARHGTHIRVSVLEYLLPGRAAALLRTGQDVATLLFTAYIAVKAVEISGILAGTPSAAMQLPMSYVYAAIVIGFGAATLRLAVRILGGWRRR